MATFAVTIDDTDLPTLQGVVGKDGKDIESWLASEAKAVVLGVQNNTALAAKREAIASLGFKANDPLESLAIEQIQAIAQIKK